MYYDAGRHAYVDSATHEVVFTLDASERPPPPPSAPSSSPPRSKARELQEKRDRDLALQLSRGGGGGGGVVVGVGESDFRYLPSLPSTQHRYQKEDGFSDLQLARQLSSQMNEVEMVGMGSGGSLGRGGNNRLNLDEYSLQVEEENQLHRQAAPPAGWSWDDWTLARTLQALEFEIEEETLEEREARELDGEFTRKEISASSCCKQLKTLSTFICVAQVAILITMIEWDGFDTMANNPLYGPPATTMVRFGAKDASLILYKGQWWRLLSPIMLHAGVFHILSNVLIQLRVGGYLNLVYGNAKWLWIYLVSGVFGNICSCIFLPDSVGVGSSGALLGMLTSWIVWIIFRWNKIPEECRGQRNCQLAMVVVSVGITLILSFASFVDWAAHMGGAIQGFLWGAVLLSNELDNQHSRLFLRVTGASASFALYVAALWYMTKMLHPSRYAWPLYAVNDDWNHHGERFPNNN